MPNPEISGSDSEMCAQCRRHVREGGPLEQNTALIRARRMNKFAPEGERWCSRCTKYLPVEDFALRSDSGSRRYSLCKPCKQESGRAHAWKNKFGITPEQYDQIMELQGGCCAICRRPPLPGERFLAVDHDHQCCGKGRGCPSCIRGALCKSCNQMVGFAQDDPETLQRAADYLDDPPARRILAEHRAKTR